MKIQNLESKDKLIARLRRVAGQIRGIESMVNEERDCKEILQQLAAVRSAMQGINRVFLQEYAGACLSEIDEDTPVEARLAARSKREKLVQEMITLFDKAS